MYSLHIWQEKAIPRKREEWIPIFALYNFREKWLNNTSKKGWHFLNNVCQSCILGITLSSKASRSIPCILGITLSSKASRSIPCILGITLRSKASRSIPFWQKWHCTVVDTSRHNRLPGGWISFTGHFTESSQVNKFHRAFSDNVWASQDRTATYHATTVCQVVEYPPQVTPQSHKSYGPQRILSCVLRQDLSLTRQNY